MFHRFSIDYKHDTFKQFSESIIFEDVCDGRKAANLVDCKNNLIPIVRTTTSYNNPVQRLLSRHYELIGNIRKVSEIKELELNNAMVEIYEPTYRNMGFHSDQMLDLADDSHICIFSCYDDEKTKDIRKLKIRNKESRECSEILLDHNTVVIFPIDANRKHVHKIMLDTPKSKTRWLGITFRLSKTFIQIENDVATFYSDNEILRMADDSERKEFLKHKSLENSMVKYSYPKIYYTLSISDTMRIK